MDWKVLEASPRLMRRKLFHPYFQFKKRNGTGCDAPTSTNRTPPVRDADGDATVWDNYDAGDHALMRPSCWARAGGGAERRQGWSEA